MPRKSSSAGAPEDSPETSPPATPSEAVTGSAEPVSWSPPTYAPPPAPSRQGIGLGLLIIVIVLAVAAGAVSGYVAGSRVRPVVSGLVDTTTTPNPNSALVAESSLAMQEAFRKVSPAVVTIVVTGAGQEAVGTGVIFDSEGHILTNDHVIRAGNTYKVLYASGGRSSATVVGRDPVFDLAVIKVDDKVPGIAQFGSSAGLQPGQQVLAIGAALGDYRNSVTSGIISALHRNLPGKTEIDDMIQFDAAINHGNSGGPLVDLNGHVVGINTAIAASDPASGDRAEGIGFAIPSDRARDVASELVAKHSITHPFLGIQYRSVDSQVQAGKNLPVDHGALVTSVSPQSPSDRAGLKKDDIILAINGQAIDLDNTLFSLLSRHQAGEKVRLQVQRGGSKLSIDVTLGKRPDNL